MGNYQPKSAAEIQFVGHGLLSFTSFPSEEATIVLHTKIILSVSMLTTFVNELTQWHLLLVGGLMTLIWDRVD